MSKVHKTETWEEAKKLQKEAGDAPDTNKQFREAEHQAREDAMKAGLLPEREENKRKQDEKKNEQKEGLFPDREQNKRDKDLGR